MGRMLATMKEEKQADKLKECMLAIKELRIKARKQNVMDLAYRQTRKLLECIGKRKQ